MQKSVFCMVLSSVRLIQGIACFLSLYKNTEDFKLYVLCADDECYEFLKKFNFDKLVLVNIQELNREDLLQLKVVRKLNQYCWTLKPGFVKYIFNLDNNIERVTYIDSDLFFFQDPNIIFENQPDASILLSSGEIFLPMYSKEFNHHMQKLAGNFNSGFISFKRDVNGLECVNWWDKKCADSCTLRPENNKFGDQKYLDDMPLLFKNVQEITTQGINIGHWNYPKYNFSIVDDTIMVNNTKLIFYHFSGFRIISKYDIRQIHEKDRINVPFIYQIYRKKLESIIDDVEKIDPDFKEYRTTAEIDDNRIKQGEKVMKASVIIPSYNSKERLYYNLISLNNQDCDFNLFEVIVVDNGSKDNTLEMLKNFEANFTLKFMRLENNKGIAKGRNEGIKKAIGDILIFHDSDMIAPRNFVTSHLKNHEEKNIVVCGVPWKRIFTFYYKELDINNENYLDKNVPKLELKSNMSDKYPLIDQKSIIDGSYMKKSFDLNIEFMRGLKEILKQCNGELTDYVLPWRFFITNNASVERSRVIELGMFDEDIVGYGFEDYDLGIRLYKSGSKFIFDETILNVHQEHPTNINIYEARENINYICNKYNNIYFLDVILVCIAGTTSINDYVFNELAKDINNMMSVSYFKPLLDIFLELLQTCRRRFFIEGVTDINKVMPTVNIDISQLIMDVKILRDVFGIKYFTKAMLALIEDIYKISN